MACDGSNVRRAYAGSRWEKEIGFCRAIRKGNHIFVTGTAPIADDGSTFAPGDARAQTERCLKIIEKALSDLGASKTDIMRTRMFVTDISRWEEYSAAFGEFFAGHHPANTMVEITALVAPDMLIEIEAEAIASQ